MTASRQRGTRWETAIVDYLRTSGWPFVERRARNGAKDRGDVAGLINWVIEAKSEKRISLAGWIAEAETERVNDGAEHCAVWAHRKGKASPGDGYVVMTGAQFTALLKAAGYGGDG